MLAVVAVSTAAPATAQSVKVSVDSTLADYIVDMACSGKEIDEDRLRNSRLLKTQIKHHSGNSDLFNMDGFIEAARAAARCETLERDLYRLRYLVEDKATIAGAVAYFKAHEAELAEFVEEKTAPYFPAGQDFSGEIVIVAASWSCGGFSMDGAFFIDVPCVAHSIEGEFQAVKILAAHETYHALQYAFFEPFSEDMAPIQTVDEAQAYLFLNLLLEGTAEFVADSRDVPGEGTLAKVFRQFAARGDRQMDDNFRWLDYAFAILAIDDSSNQRIRDVYDFGFSGSTDQKFYYVGAAMARRIEAVFGRESLVCIMAKSPEQFALAYDAALDQVGSQSDLAIGPSALESAKRLGKGKASFSSCLQN